MGKAHDLKMFTLEEANRLLPRLEVWLKELQSARQAILSLEVEIDALELVVDKDDSHARRSHVRPVLVGI